MESKMKAKVKYLILAIVMLIIVLTAQKLYLTPSPQKPPNLPPEATKAVQLELEYPYEVKNVADQEKVAVLQLVRTFETLQYERKAKEVLALFTPPSNDNERNDLDFLEGKDLNSSPRLYVTAGYPWSLNWYMVRKIEKQNDKLQITLKELRTYYANSDGDYTGDNQNLILVIIESSGSYKIDQYFHEKLSPNVNRKYEGFN
ncbi:MAG: hypothetical protein PHE48_02890 [Candidatus Daviesbacteria bacterium]|nr:hypothetical protein [Candidatus Daviesbacteria bacterium]